MFGQGEEGLQDLLASFRHPETRDLLWALLSPALIKGDANSEVLGRAWGQDLFQASEDWFRKQDETGALPDFLTRHNSPLLGIYFERLFEFLFERHPFFELLGKNVQLIEEGHTLGELDLLYRDVRQARDYHLELAIKYYLYHPESEDWFGPNPMDRFEDKANKLLRLQSQMGKKPAALPYLHNLGLAEASAQILCKGYLFFPWHQYQAGECVLPDVAGKDCLSGWWLLYPQWESLEGEFFRLLHKPDWLSPVVDPNEEILTRKDLTSRCTQVFKRGRRDMFVAVLERGEDRWREKSRGFILAENWPDRYLK